MHLFPHKNTKHLKERWQKSPYLTFLKEKVPSVGNFSDLLFMYSFVSGDQNHGSPMMQQNMRSQTPGMNPVPNSQQGMGQPRMVGPQGNVSLDLFFRKNSHIKNK